MTARKQRNDIIVTLSDTCEIFSICMHEKKNVELQRQWIQDVVLQQHPFPLQSLQGS